MAVIGSLSVKLGLVTVEWDKATKQAKEQAKALQKSFEDLTGGVKKLQEQWKALGGAFSVGSLGMAAMIQQTLAFTDEISDLAKGYGITISQTLAFRQALMQAGVSADGASRVMSTLFGKIDDAKKGNDTTIAQFEQLGITFKELKELSPYEAIQKVSQGFKNISDQFEKVKLIKELFGKAGIGISLEDVNDALEKGTDKFDKYAESIEKVGRINDNLKQSFDNLKIAFADLISPLTRDKVTSAEQFSAILKGMAAAFVVTQIAKLAVSIYEVVAALRAAAAAGAMFNIAAGSMTPTGLLIKGGALLAGVAAFSMSLPTIETPKVSHKTPSATGEEGVLSEATEAKRENVEYDHAQVVANEKIGDLVSKQAEALRVQIGLQKQMMQFDVEKIRTAAQIQTMGETATKLALEDIQLKEKIAQIEAKRTADLVQNKEGSDALKASINGLADAEIKRAKASSAANKQSIQQAAEYKHLVESLTANPSFQRMERMQQEATEAAAKAQRESDIAARYEHGKTADEQIRLNKLANERLDYENSLYLLSQQERDVLLQEYDLEAKITEFKYQQRKLGQDPAITEERVKDLREVGKATIDLTNKTIEQQRTFDYGWKTAYDSWVENTQNMAKIGASSFETVTGAMDAALTQFVRNGKIAFKDLILDMIKNLMLLQMRSQMTSIFGSFLSNLFMPGPKGPVPGGEWGGAYADGGSIPGNKVSMVGENGPELFVPKQAGTIIPNNALGMMGNTTNVTNNYINAIDTKSFEDRLFGSSRAIWAANNYANKSLAVGTGRM